MFNIYNQFLVFIELYLIVSVILNWIVATGSGKIVFLKFKSLQFKSILIESWKRIFFVREIVKMRKNVREIVNRYPYGGLIEVNWIDEYWSQKVKCSNI